MTVMTDDGRFFLNAGGLSSAVQAKLAVSIVVTNGRGCGMITRIRNRSCDNYDFFIDQQRPRLDQFVGTACWNRDRAEELDATVTKSFAPSDGSTAGVDKAAIGGVLAYHQFSHRAA
jgi:hypothetical protein